MPTGDTGSPRQLSEWFARARSAKLEEFVQEDSTKRSRLELLREIIGLPCNDIFVISLDEIVSGGERLATIFAKFGDKPCGVRINPTHPDLPQYRKRGLSLTEALKWCTALNLDKHQYEVEIIPHVASAKWASIFVVSQDGLIGELIQGGHELLTQGWGERNALVQVRFDGEKWSSEGAHQAACLGATQHLQAALGYLNVVEPALRHRLEDVLKATFWQEFLCGYFETLESESWGLRFIDYNRRLLDYFEVTPSLPSSAAESEGYLEIIGTPASPGIATGPARIIDKDELGSVYDASGGVIVCRFTTPDDLPAIESSVAVVTEIGGMLSHAAILCRELGKPCVTGVLDARRILQGRQSVEVDGNRGIIYFGVPK